ncbi:MAG: 50S ribosomal protein L6 [Actinobacteria bacterium]|nr:50S ribosomal protein L6 [Actinomycetota bacterium]
MSRIGRMPIEVPNGVEVALGDAEVKVKGAKGKLSQRIPMGISVKSEGGQVLVERASNSKLHRSLHGLTRTLVANMVTGVSAGFEKTLEIVGVGYRAVKKGNAVEIAVGYSHPVVFEPPPGINFEVPVPTKIIIRGIDKQVVGETAAKIRAIRKPEPYKGKGIRYEAERIRRKVGKTGK